jgi:hypothetical protein
MLDPCREFSRIADVMSVNLELNRLRIKPPRIDSEVSWNGLDADTKRRITTIGYAML